MTKTPTREAIIALREERKLTRAEIAAHYGVSVATVRRWIKDMKIPRPRRRSPARKRATPAENRHWEAFNAFEQARIILGPRVIERVGHGYYLDGSPTSVEKILATSGLRKAVPDHDRERHK